jgi:hypothetical protein
MANTVNLEFAGDAKKLQAAAKDAEKANLGVGDAATSTSTDMDRAGASAQNYTDRVGQLGAGVTGMTDAVDSAGAAVQGLVDIQNAGRDKAMKLARAQADVEQAMLDGEQAAIDLEQATVDLTQAQADGRQAALDEKQAQIDLTQAQLDAETAYRAYNDAVKEYGANSEEAKQAQIDLNQARLDENQALEDSEQARIDANQALVDGKQYALDGAQAVRDGKDAQLDLNDAMHEANPSGLQAWADKINMISPILTGLIGVVGLVTAAQWAWNAAQLASPTTWIIAGIAAIIAIIVVIATKTDWFQRAWRNSWKWIKDSAGNVVDWFRKVPGWFGDIFGKAGRAISAPFRAAFNGIASLWNATVGRLNFTIPGWVPGIGGNSFGMPSIPRFHGGGTVPGPIGREQLALVEGGEKISRPGAGGGGDIVIRGDGSRMADALIELIEMAMVTRGGDPRALGLRLARS